MISPQRLTEQYDQRIQPMSIRDLTDAELLIQTAELLNEAARRSGVGKPRTDFGEFLGRTVVAAAANVGGTDNLLGGKAGSWQTLLVSDLIEGTMGVEPKDWLAYRTDGLVVPLNVAELVATHPHHEDLASLGDAMDEIHIRYWSASRTNTVIDVDDQAAYRRDLDDVEERYKTAYQSYADSFADAVRTEVERLGTPAPVNVLADTDPWSPLWKPKSIIHNPSSEYAEEADPDATRLWTLAHDITPPPIVDIRASNAVA